MNAAFGGSWRARCHPPLSKLLPSRVGRWSTYIRHRRLRDAGNAWFLKAVERSARHNNFLAGATHACPPSVSDIRINRPRASSATSAA